MIAYENPNTTNGHGGSADEAAVNRQPSLPGFTARDMFCELEETKDPRFVFPLLQAEMKGLTVRRLNCESELEEPPPADPWLIMIDDQWPTDSPENYCEETTRWLFEAADWIAMTTVDLYLGSYDEFIEAASKGQRILLILTKPENLARWLNEIVTNTSDPNNPRALEVSVKRAQRSTRPIRA
jgi:hypothetical protein